MAENSLEQQALDRVARMYAGYERRQPRGRAPAAPDPPPAEPDAPAGAEEGAHRKEDQPKKQPGLIEALLDDREESLILMLLILLMKDGADMNAVLALLYLLL